MIKKYFDYIKENIDWLDDDLDYEEEEDPEDFITDDEFRNFLIKHGCLREYAENVHDKEERNRHLGLNDTFSKDFDIYKKSGRNYINAGLVWNDTPEGREYWAKLDIEWMRIVARERNEKARKIREEKNRIKKEKIKLEKSENKKKLIAVKKGESKDFITDDEFRDFLIKHKCYDLYIKNCYTRARKGFIEGFNKVPKRLYIFNAFNWGVKGEYWKAVNDEWIKILDEKRKKEKEERKQGRGKKYEDFITNDEFRDFLLDNDYYDEYIENCLTDKTRARIGLSYKNFEKIPERSYMSLFDWNKTPQKFKYWNDANIKWYNIVEKNIDKKINIIIERIKKSKEKREKGEEQYDDFITSDEFRNFLIKNKCYDEYIENCLNPIRKDFLVNIKSYGDRGIINSAFTWNDTPEGYKFWSELDRKWNHRNMK